MPREIPDPELPAPWKALYDDDTRAKYYWNKETQVTTYDRPAAAPARAPPAVRSLSAPAAVMCLRYSGRMVGCALWSRRQQRFAGPFGVVAAGHRLNKEWQRIVGRLEHQTVGALPGSIRCRRSGDLPSRRPPLPSSTSAALNIAESLTSVRYLLPAQPSPALGPVREL